MKKGRTSCKFWLPVFCYAFTAQTEKPVQGWVLKHYTIINSSFIIYLAQLYLFLGLNVTPNFASPRIGATIIVSLWSYGVWSSCLIVTGSHLTLALAASKRTVISAACSGRQQGNYVTKQTAAAAAAIFYPEANAVVVVVLWEAKVIERTHM
jgi:hypothetical protein